MAEPRASRASEEGRGGREGRSRLRRPRRRRASASTASTAQIQALIAERAQLGAAQVGKAKGPLKAAVDYYRPEREAQVLRQVVDRNDGPLSDEVLVRAVPRNHVGLPGAAGAAARSATSAPRARSRSRRCSSTSAIPRAACRWRAIEEVFEEVEAGNADFGVVPVENSGQGTIQSTLDMFLTSTLKICGEVELRVHQYLLSRTGRLEDIERVYSHPQSLAQCKAWLRQHLPKAEKRAGGEQRRSRAARAQCRRRGGDRRRNRGARLRPEGRSPARSRTAPTTPRASSCSAASCSRLRPRPHLAAGVRATTSPARCTACSARSREHGVSMNRIESRPSHQGRWQYAFFIDVAGHVDEGPVKARARRARRVRGRGARCSARIRWRCSDRCRRPTSRRWRNRRRARCAPTIRAMDLVALRARCRRRAGRARLEREQLRAEPARARGAARRARPSLSLSRSARPRAASARSRRSIGVGREQIVLGNGSHELLMLVAQVLRRPRRRSASLQRVRLRGVRDRARPRGAALRTRAARCPLDDAMPRGHDLDALARGMSPRTRLVYLATPTTRPAPGSPRDELRGVPRARPATCWSWSTRPTSSTSTDPALRSALALARRASRTWS